MTIQEKFIAWMKDQGAWDEYVKYCENAGYIFDAQCYISSAFAWFETESGYSYWENINYKWLKYLENNN